MQPYMQSNDSFETISKRIWKHLEERDWLDNQARDLAISICLEANELLEHYQWSDKTVGTTKDHAEELADIMIYAFQYAQIEGIDIADAIKRKLEKSAQKYPAGKFKGKSRQDRRNAWLDAKLDHRKDGL